MRTKTDPTQSQFGAYSAAFDYFNDALFGGHLPHSMLNFSRKAGSVGFFAPDRWSRGGDRTHEISLNPDLLDMNPREVFQTLVHEMVHLWQRTYGKPASRGYHNREWAVAMKRVGLMPSSTGKPGGSTTGQKMSDYVIPGGAFEQAFAAMPKDCLLPWVSGLPIAEGEETEAKRNKIKYVCPDCEAKVWGKPSLRILCLECEVEFRQSD
jgi:predicted SprT family Zn-dependent metalloprotease